MLAGGCTTTPKLTPEGLQAREVEAWIQSLEKALETAPMEEVQAFFSPDLRDALASLKTFTNRRLRYASLDLELWIQQIHHHKGTLEVFLFWDLEAHREGQPVPVYRHGDLGLLLPDHPPYRLLQVRGLAPWNPGVLP